MFELTSVIFLIFVAISTTVSYAIGFNRGQEHGMNFVIDGMIEKGILEVVDEEDETLDLVEKDEK